MPAITTTAKDVTERDRQIFQFLFENKAATALQLAELFFENKNTKIAYKRLYRLSRSGWLRKGGYLHHERPHILYGVSDEAFDQYVLEPGVNDRRRQLRSDCIDHDLALVDILICFKKNRATQKYIPENLLQSSHEFAESNEWKSLVELRSDAGVELLIQDQYRYLVPIEYEASLKSKERCRNKIHRYYMRHDGDAVFMICKDQSVLNRMVETELEVSRETKPKMYFSLLSDVLKNPSQMTFTQAQGDKYVIE